MSDDLAAFHRALPAHVARWYTLDAVTIPLVTAAVANVAPAELARICALGLPRNVDQAHARRVIKFRLKRAAGTLEDQEAEA